MINSDLQKLGGIAALIEAALYVTGFGLFLTVLDPSGYEGHVQKVTFLADKQVALYVANLLIYVVFGVVLVVLTLALNARLKDGSPAIMQTATAFGLIWAGLVIASGMIANIGSSTVVELSSENQDQAVMLWLTLATVQEALGGGNEIVGGLWVLLLSWAALRTDKLPKPLNYLGMLVGLAGILTVAPNFDVLMDVFGLGQIVWFAWLGTVMLRGDRNAT
jgi:hypothetical protein